MKRTLIFSIIIVLLCNPYSVIAEASEKPEYTSKIANMTLDEALKIRYLAEKENSKESEAPVVELISYKEKDGKLIIPLKDALKNLEYTDPHIQLYDKQLSLYKKQYSISLDEAISARIVVDMTDTVLRKKEKLNWKEKLNVLENHEQDRSNFIYNAKAKFQRSYINAVQLQKDSAAILTELDKLEISINHAKLKLQNGLIKSSELNGMNSTKAQLVAQANAIGRQLEIIKLDLKKALGIEMSKDISVVEADKVFTKFLDDSLEEKIKAAVQESFELEKAVKDLDLTKLKYKIVTTYYGETYPAEADSIETSIEQKEHDLKLIALKKESDLWNSYYSIKNLEDNIEIQRINVKLAELNLHDVQTKIKLNKAIALDELSSSVNLSKANNKLQSLINEYMLSQESFNRELGNKK